MLRMLVACLIVVVFLAGCGAPKAVKLDGTDRVPVNAPDKNGIQIVKDGGVKK
jgi:hypothetical protein